MNALTRRVYAICVLVTAASPCRSAGDWSFVPPSPLGGRTDFFYDVDGIGSGDVWAVGFWEPPTTDRKSLIEHFDGHAWTQSPTPDTGVTAPFESLTGVVATASDHAVAVGSYTPIGSTGQPLAMEWNGSDWELLSTPEFSGGGVFSPVDATVDGHVWVGGWIAGSAFVARQNGGSWDLEWAPPVSGFRNRFYAMHARTDDEIWVVGTHGTGFGDFRILIQRYDGGSSWTTFDVPTPGWDDSLQGVVAFAPDDVWVAGYYYHTTLFHFQPLLMHFDGSAWSTVTLPAFTEGSAELRDISGTGPDDVTAAGTYATADGTPRPFMLHYDGSAWAEVELPVTGGSGEWFRGVGTTADGTVWAVGQYFDGVSTEPMAFHDGDVAVSAGDVPVTPLTLQSFASPNPSRAGIAVRYSSAARGAARLRIWDVTGRLVRELHEPRASVGPRSMPWDGTDDAGRPALPGSYYYELTLGESSSRRSFVLVR